LADSWNGHEIKDYLDLVNELGLAEVDEKLRAERDLVKKALEAAIPDFCKRSFDSLTKKKITGSKFEKEMVKNFKAGYIHRPLSADGSLYTDGRFHRTDWPNRCFYLAPNEHVVCAECRIDPFEVKSPRVNVWINVKLGNVFNVPLLESKFPFLQLISKEPWEWVNTETISFTQFFGNFIASQGYSGIVYQSARMDDPAAQNLCVFPKNMGKGDLIQIIDPDGVYNLLHTPPKHLELTAI
jgi:hypothetical protein